MSAGRKVTANLPRLNALMDEARLDAIVLRSGHNFAYLSGVVYSGTLARTMDLTDSNRASLLLWPRNGKPVILTNRPAAGLAKRDSWVETIDLYEAYIESPYAKLAELAKAAGLAHARVGFEKDFVSARDWEIVQSSLPRMQMVDCTDLMNRVRWIKTADEVEMIRRAADLLDDIFAEVFHRVRPGDTERKIHTDMVATCLAKGFEWAHGILNSDKNTVPWGGESDLVINRGDVIRTDYVAYLHAYPGHQSRSAIVGKPSATQRAEYRAYMDIYRATADRCRAGVKVNDLWQFVMKEFDKHGWSHQSLMIGHSIGPWWHQQEPVMRYGSDPKLELEEGMVLALEPRKDHWHVQDLILIQEGPPVLLSPKFNTDEPFVVAN